MLLVPDEPDSRRGFPGFVASRRQGRLAAVAVAAACVALAVPSALVAGWGYRVLALVALFLAGVVLSAADRSLAAPYLALLLPLGFWRPHVGGVSVGGLEAALLGAALGCLPGLVKRRSVSAVGTPTIAFGFFVVAVVLLGALAPDRVPSWNHDAASWIALGIVFAASVPAQRESSARTRLLVALGFAALFESIVALVQYARATSDRFSLLGGAIVYPQPDGTLLHPNALGSFLAVCLLLIAGAGLAAFGLVRLGWFTTGLVVAVAIVVTFSRGAWVAVAAGALAWAAAQGRPRRVLALAGGIVSCGAAAAVLDHGAVGSRLASLGSGDFSALYGFRFELARRAIHIAARHPLTGAGSFHEIGVYVGRPTLATHPHDLLLGVAVFYGIPAAVAFTAVLGFALRGAIRALSSRLPRVRGEAAGALGALTVVLVDGLFEYPFWNPAWTVLATLVVGYATALGGAGARRTREFDTGRPRLGRRSLAAREISSRG